MNRHLLQVLMLCAAFGAGIQQTVCQERLSAGSIAYNYVGRVYIDPATGTGLVAGYFVSIAGIDHPFQGPRSEATAIFTYRSDPLHFSALPPDVDTATTVLNASNWHI